LSAEDAPTHYLDCNPFLIQPSKDLKKISLLMTNSKEKPKELKGKSIFKKKDCNNWKGKIGDGKKSSLIKIN
jgi:hypothetical protein